MKDLTTTSFGLIIAYLLPGAVGLYTLVFFIKPFKDVADKFFSANSDVGLFLVGVAAALIMGLQINLLRWALYEKFLFSNLKLSALDYGKLDTENKLKLVLYIIEENYRYHQFYGGMTVIMPLLYLAIIKTYYPTFMESPSRTVMTVLFITASTTALSLSLMKLTRTGKYFEKTKSTVLAIGSVIAIAVLSLGWLFFYSESQNDKVRFALLTIGFVILEVATGAAAFAARARYVNRATQIIRGA